MKRTIIVLLSMLIVFVAVFTVLVLRPLPKVNADHHGCTLATLTGSYGVVGSGSALDDAEVWFPASLSAVFTFNGAGGVSGANIYTIVAGHIIQSDQAFSDGAYTINSNCSVVITIPSLFGAEDVYIYGSVVDTGGDEFTGQLQSTLNNVTGTGDGKRIVQGRWNNLLR